MSTQKPKETDNEKNNEKNFVVMLLILTALIIIIFLLVRNLGFIEHRPRIPTGNVDIFDITFKKECDNSCNCTCNNNSCGSCNSGSGTSNNGGSTNNGGGSSGDDSDIPTISDKPNPPDVPLDIEVFDKETEYSQDTQLHIFTNTAYVVENKIAPSSENSYQFIIRNNNSFSIKYDLELSEENEKEINMKYRLKLNGVYVAGSDSEWLTYKELKQENIALVGNTYDVYTLDWKWFESENDTEVGTSINSNYKLELKITASGY